MIVLNTLFKLTGRLSERIRDILCVIMIAGIESVSLFFNYWGKINGDAFGYKELFLVNTALLCLAILFSIKEELKPVEWKKILFYCWFAVGILVALPIPDMAGRGTFIMFGGLISFVFPAFYFVWNNRGDYGKLYRLVAIATVISAMLFFIKCILEAPVVVGAAYEGITDNSNTIGIATIGGAIASLALICTEGRWKYLYMATFGILIAFTLLSQSRASLLAILLAGAAFVIAMVRGADGGRITKAIADLLILVVITGVISVSLQKIMTRDEPFIHNAKLERATERELAAEKDARWKAVAEGKLSEETARRLDAIADGTYDPDEDTADDDIGDKFTKGDGNVERLTSGRVSTWKYYIKHLRLTGHSRKNGDPYIKERGLTAAAHNTYLEIGYRSGIIPGILYGCIAVYAAIWCFAYLFGKKKSFDKSIILVVLAVFAFGVMSNLERAVYPIEKVHILLYFLALTPMFEAKKRIEK